MSAKKNSKAAAFVVRSNRSDRSFLTPEERRELRDLERAESVVDELGAALYGLKQRTHYPRYPQLTDKVVQRALEIAPDAVQEATNSGREINVQRLLALPDEIAWASAVEKRLDKYCRTIGREIERLKMFGKKRRIAAERALLAKITNRREARQR